MEAAEIEAAAQEVLAELRRFSPEVEPSDQEPGVSWLNADGIEPLFGPLQTWASEAAAALAARQLRATVVVGFDRFSTYALARARAAGGVQVLASAEEERERSDRVPLHRLGLDARLRDGLGQLGVAEVGAFRRLPAGSLRSRFGGDAERLHRAARGVLRDPLAPQPIVEAPREELAREPGEGDLDVTALLFLCKQRLARITRTLGRRGQAIAVMVLRLRFEKLDEREESVSPAEPTLDEVQLTDLLRLRLESLRLDAELVGFELSAEAVAATAVQRDLFAAVRQREVAAANRALARLRAELGDAAVVQAELREGHLPEATFRWRPLAAMEVPQTAREPSSPRLVRSVLDRPRLLTPVAADDRGRGDPVVDVQGLSGPYAISGGWWAGERHREYYFAETRRGDILWVYYDRSRRRWFLQGIVE